MQKIFLLACFILVLGVCTIQGQVTLGYVTNSPDALYLWGNLKSDCKLEGRGSERRYECDQGKSYFIAQVKYLPNGRAVDEAYMNINGKAVVLKSQPRKSRGEHDFISGSVWLSDGKGIKVLFNRYGKEGDLGPKMKVTVQVGTQKKSMDLIWQTMGD